MNLIDQLVGMINPMAGLRRAQARSALELMRGYDAAKVGRRTDGWVANGGSANVEIAPKRPPEDASSSTRAAVHDVGQVHDDPPAAARRARDGA